MKNAAIKNLTLPDKKQILGVLSGLISGPASPEGVREFLDKTFVPATEVDVDTLVIRSSVGEWCIGLEELAEIWGMSWQDLAEVSMHVSNVVISAEGDTAWLDAKAEIHVVMKNNLLLGQLARNIQGILQNSDGMSIEEILRLAKSADRGLFEDSTGQKFAWTFRLSGILLRKRHPWRFQQLKFNFLRK